MNCLSKQDGGQIEKCLNQAIDFFTIVENYTKNINMKKKPINDEKFCKNNVYPRYICDQANDYIIQ